MLRADRPVTLAFAEGWRRLDASNDDLDFLGRAK
jgi:hypothetical protein